MNRASKIEQTQLLLAHKAESACFANELTDVNNLKSSLQPSERSEVRVKSLSIRNLDFIRGYS